MISPALNRRILSLAPRHGVSDKAPGTFLDLMASPGLVVWSGGSDKTIYGDPSVNWAFRAWHDSIHKALNAPFTIEGEGLVAIEQARQIGGTFGDIVTLEINAQAEYFEKHGQFPNDQTTFMIEVMRRAGIK